jgi:hypothetical protein
VGEECRRGVQERSAGEERRRGVKEEGVGEERRRGVQERSVPSQKFAISVSSSIHPCPTSSDGALQASALKVNREGSCSCSGGPEARLIGFLPQK